MIKEGKKRLIITIDGDIFNNLENESILKGMTKSEIVEKILRQNDFHIPYEYSSKRNSSNSSLYKP